MNEKRTIVKGKETPEGVLFRLRENGEVKYKEVPLKNYFYVKTSDYELFKNEIRDLNYIIFDIEEVKEYTKIILNNNFMRNTLRERFKELNVETFESDIPTPKRWLIKYPEYEMNSKNSTYAFWDIETNDYGNFEFDNQGKVIANKQILSCSIVDMDQNVYYLENEGWKYIDPEDLNIIKSKWSKDTQIYELKQKIKQLREDEYDNQADHIEEIKGLNEKIDELEKSFNLDEIKKAQERIENVLVEHEKKLIQEIVNTTLNYDIICSYNGENFDIPYIKQRADFHGISLDKWKLINNLDYLLIYKKNTWESKTSYSLDAVAEDELKEK
ncbi:MAG: 3'-5' exonuclease, partial [archaeon]